MSGGETSRTEPGRKIDIPSVPNLRDIGGYAVAGGGRVKTGQLYRSVDLYHLHGDDVAALASLGIRTVVDLRTEAERSAQPDVLPPGAEAVVCDVLAGDEQAAPAELFEPTGDPVAAQEMFGDGKAAELFLRWVPQDRRSAERCGGLSHLLRGHRAGRASAGPLPLHHGQGQDRLGGREHAAAPRGLGGGRLPRLPADEPRPAAGPQAAVRQVRGGRRRPAPARPGMGVDRSYLQAALDEMRAQYGSVEAYFADGLGIDAAQQAALRRELVEPAA